MVHLKRSKRDGKHMVNGNTLMGANDERSAAMRFKYIQQKNIDKSVTTCMYYSSDSQITELSSKEKKQYSLQKKKHIMQKVFRVPCLIWEE